MNRDSVDIAWIVAEVVRRLQRHASARPTPDYETNAADTPIAPVPAPGVCHITSRLVTLATLPENLSGIKRLQIPPRAVVTPAVKDELRKRSIQLETKVAPTSTQNESTGLEIVRCTAQHDAGGKAQSLGRLTETPISAQPALPRAIEYITSVVRDPARVVVLLTDQPLPAVCLANRNPAIRAAAGASSTEAKQAVDAIGANLFVVDPRQVSGSQWKEIVQQFQAELPRSWPEVLGARN